MIEEDRGPSRETLAVMIEAHRREVNAWQEGERLIRAEAGHRLDERWQAKYAADATLAATLAARLDVLRVEFEAATARLHDEVAEVRASLGSYVTGPQQWATQRRSMWFGVIGATLALGSFLFLLFHVIARGEF